jgi:hypothetical protein
MISSPQNVRSNQASIKINPSFRDVLSFGYMLLAVFGYPKGVDESCSHGIPLRRSFVSRVEDQVDDVPAAEAAGDTANRRSRTVRRRRNGRAGDNAVQDANSETIAL